MGEIQSLIKLLEEGNYYEISRRLSAEGSAVNPGISVASTLSLYQHFTASQEPQYNECIEYIRNIADCLIAETNFIDACHSIRIQPSQKSIDDLRQACFSNTKNPATYLARAGQFLYSQDLFSEADVIYSHLCEISEGANPSLYDTALTYKGLIKFKQQINCQAEHLFRLAMKTHSLHDSNYWDGMSQCNEIVVIAPGGIGDIIIAQRHGVNLRKYAQTVSCLMPRKLIPLLSLSGHYHKYYPIEDANNIVQALGKDAKYVSQLHLLGVDSFLTNMSPTKNYLITDLKADNYWRSLISCHEDQLKVGLCWQGKKNSPNHPGRSFDLADLSPLGNLNNCVLISLQPGYGSEALASSEISHQFTAHSDEIESKRDFINTASLVKTCDLVVSCDTGIAQLAAALGRPTLVLCKRINSAWWNHIAGQSNMHASARVFNLCEGESWKSLVARATQYIADSESLARH